MMRRATSKKLCDQYYSYCLKAELPKAVELLFQRTERITPQLNKLRAKCKRRFADGTEVFEIPTKISFVKQLILCYRTYYKNVLLKLNSPEKAEKQLFHSLKELASHYKAAPPGVSRFDDLEKGLQSYLYKINHHALFGKVLPFRSLLLWRTEKKTIYTVHLPEGRVRLPVIFMDGFLELGWLNFATFGKYSVGGWAKERAIYCVKSAYKIGSPEFRISYLVHEAQHYCDKIRFPQLSRKQVELEYRAKLAEIGCSPRPRHRLNRFIKEGDIASSSPHSQASYLLGANLALLLFGKNHDPSLDLFRKISGNELREAVFSLLLEHSSQLEAGFT